MDGFHVFHLDHIQHWRHPANVSALWICLLLLLFSHLRELTLEDSEIRDTTHFSPMELVVDWNLYHCMRMTVLTGIF